MIKLTTTPRVTPTVTMTDAEWQWHEMTMKMEIVTWKSFCPKQLNYDFPVNELICISVFHATRWQCCQSFLEDPSPMVELRKWHWLQGSTLNAPNQPLIWPLGRILITPLESVGSEAKFNNVMWAAVAQWFEHRTVNWENLGWNLCCHVESWTSSLTSNCSCWFSRMNEALAVD